MPPSIATFVFALIIAGLFYLDHDKNAQTSKGLWLPVIWLSIAGSRNISAWLGETQSLDSPDRYLEGNPVDRFVFTALIVAGLMVLASRRQRAAALLRKNGPILLFFAYCAISILWSDYPDVAFKRWTKAIGELVMILIVLTERDRLTAWKRLLARASFLLLPLSVLFVKYYPSLGRGYNRWSWTTNYTGIATGKNELGAICLVFGLGALWRLCNTPRGIGFSRKYWPFMAQGMVLAMSLWLLHLSNSMTSLSCFLMASTLVVVMSLRRFARKIWVAHLLVAGMICFSVFIIFFNAGGGVLEQMGRNSTITGRTDVWKGVFSLAGNPLIGTGFESFWLGKRVETLWRVFWWHPNEAHNGYIEVYLSLGWIGVVLLALILVTGYRTVMAALRRGSPESKLRLAFLVTALIYNLTETAAFMLHPVWILFVLSVFVVPEPAASDATPLLKEDAIEELVENEWQVDPVLLSGSFRENP